MSCLLTTPEIIKLKESFPSETIESVKNLVSLWQEQAIKSMDEYPSASELNKFKLSIRDKDKQNSIDNSSFGNAGIVSLKEQNALVTEFGVIELRDRVSLISRLFSNEVTKAIQEIKTSINEKIENSSDADRVYLQAEYDSVDRISAINKYTPLGIFNRILDMFNSYITDTDENRIQQELNVINANEQSMIDDGSISESERFSEQDKLASATAKANYKNVAYSKIVRNFKAIADLASNSLVLTEGIRVSPQFIKTKNASFAEDTPEGESQSETDAEDWSKEEVIKDNWMTHFSQVSPNESLSQAVRKVIREIPRLDYEGYYEEDDLGFTRYLQPDYVHATLIDELRYMSTVDDMIPLIEKLERRKPWVSQIKELLQEDETLFSKFYQDFRKDFSPYWIQKRKNMPDGTFKMETISVNKPEGVYYLFDQWRDNYENGILLDPDSIYNKNGTINQENVDKGIKWINTLNNKFTNLDTESRLNLLNQDNIWKTINKLLNMIGVDANPSILYTALTDIKTGKGVTYPNPIMLLLPQLHIIYNGVKKGKIEKANDESDEGSNRKDLINTFGSAYNQIASMLAEVSDEAVESSVRENNKSYYSYTSPNYLGKLLKNLKDVMGDKERFNNFINSEFKNFEWFYKNGEWRNEWIKLISESDEFRNALDHKILLNSNKVEYSDWDSLDYTLVLLTEYFAEPIKTNSSSNMAWYHVPILSDSPSAQFIRFKKYVNGSEYDENGNKLTYQELITDKIIDTINQEYDRIMLVRQRDAAYNNGDTSILPIANYDITRNKDGKIKSLGGAEFKFYPALNNIVYENGESFIDRLSSLKANSSGDRLREFLRETVNDIMEDGFESDFNKWEQIGLFEELPNGKLKNLKYDSASKHNSIVAKSLIKVKELLGNDFTSEMENLLNQYLNNKNVNDREATAIFDFINMLLDIKVANNQLSEVDRLKLSNTLFVKNNAKEALREYYWNSKFATSQIIQLTTTDLAFYSSLEDFQKRFKEIYAPSLRMNTNSKYGRKVERTIYLKDEEIESKGLSDIEEILNAKVQKGELSTLDKNIILNKFKEVNVADAQAYRSLSSYRAIMDMSGRWDDKMQQAFDNIKNGIWNMSDFNVVWQTKKPYLYTQVENTSGISNADGTDISIKTPVQHKNSEFLLLAMYNIISGSVNKSEKLRAINEFMEKNNIDVVQFESTTKVGKQGIIDLSGVNSRADVLNKLSQDTGISSGNENPNVVHKVSYEDYGIQVETAEHLVNAIQLVGTQIRKLIAADISNDPNLRINVNGKSFTKQEWLDLYNAINTENIIQSFMEINEIFKDPKNIEKKLLEEIKDNPRYGNDLITACTLDEQGNFNIPLFDPVQSLKVQQLLNSIIKSSVTKQKIKGGALIQVSNYGLLDELSIVYEGTGDNKRIKYLECYMPAYSAELFKPLMKEGTHELDVTKLPDSLRKLIGYRVPTEDKYSMVPLYIKGFLPQQNGSAIMLPSEITTLSGSDFDVDKLYIMLPELKVNKLYNIKSAWDSFYTDPANKDIVNEIDKNYGELLNKFIEEQTEDWDEAPDAEDLVDFQEEFDTWLKKSNYKKYNLSETAKERFSEWFKLRKESFFRKYSIQKIDYDFSKSPKENGLKARNNLLIDMMFGVLTNSDTASKVLNPGGFDPQKKAARIMSILNSANENELKVILNRMGIKYNEDSVASSLFNLDLETLSNIAMLSKKQADPISPVTQVDLHQQNMTGAKLISVYANHNANHALIQHTNLALEESEGAFILNGKLLTSLHNIVNNNKEFISRNNAGFLAASVDNVKDPILALLNQNLFTADASMLLSRLGYNAIEIGLLMNQPIVMDITRTYFRESREGKYKDTIIESVINNYKKKASLSSNLNYSNYKSEPFMAKDLADNIIISKEMQGITNQNQTSDMRKVNFYKNQVAVGYLFARIMKSSEALSDVVAATRADTQGGGAGPSIADTINKIQKVEDLLDKVNSGKYALKNADIVNNSISYEGDEDKLRNALLGSNLTYLQAFYTLGLKQTSSLMGNYFPHFTKPFLKVIKDLKNKTKSGKLDVKTMNNVYNDLLAFIMTKNQFFGDEYTNDNQLSTEEKRNSFINNFPAYFNNVIGSNPDIANLEFVKRLKVAKADSNNPVDTIIFRNVGKLSVSQRDSFMQDWSSLLYMENPEAQQFAFNLVKYNFFRNGFAFGPNTFIHLAPSILRIAIPDYISTLRSLLTNEDNYDLFIDQYIFNHLDNRRFVPEIPLDTTVKFSDDKGKPINSVNFLITESSNESDKKVIKSTESVDGEKIYEFFDYITKNEKGRNIYYRKSSDNIEGSNLVTYERIAPLGYKNSFIEYEYGKSVDDIQSVIKNNSLEYDPYSESLALFDDDSYSASEDYSEAVTAPDYIPFNEEAFKQVYDSTLYSNPNDAFTSYNPNNDFRDDEGNPICG